MKKLLILSMVSIVAVGAWRFHSSAPKSRLAVNLVWIDHMPKNERDVVNVFVALTEQPVGGFNATSMWRGSFEAFRYELSGDDMRIVYPQNGDRDKVRVRAKECDDRGMDYCLELDGASRGVKNYYSREGWEIETLDQAKALVAKLTP